jgi:polysaccharide chain length determinant protein (PEP-CTERM system associated)
MSNELLVSNELTPILFSEARRRRVTLVILFAVLALAGLVAGLLWPKNFASSTSILVQESNIIKPLMEGRAVTTGNADRAAIAREVIFSRKILEEIVDAGGWKKSNPTPLQVERIIDDIKSRISVINLRENLLQITYKDSDPERAYNVTKRLADLFISESLDAKERESSEAYRFIDSQVEIYRSKLTDAEDKLKAYRGQNADARPGSEKDSSTRIGELRTQVENARMDLMEQRSKESALVAQLSGETEITAVQTREGQYRVRLAELQTQLDTLMLTYTDAHPDVIRVRHQMQDLQDQVRREQAQRAQRTAAGTPTPVDDSVQFNPLYQELRSKLAEVRRNIAAEQSRMGASDSLLNSELDRGRRIADSENKLSELTRDYEVNRDIYQDLLKRRENARVSMNLDADHRGLTFVIQEPAELPLRPSGLRFMHFSLAGVGAGVILPMVLLFGLVRFDPRIRMASQIERLTGIPVLASVPLYATRQDHWRSRRTTILLILLVFAVFAAYAAIAMMKAKAFL